MYIACAAVVTNIVSIAAGQILLGAALLILIITRQRLRVPPIGLPLLVFFTGTLISWAASGEWHAGLPQIKKFYVWLLVIVVYSAVRKVDQVRWLLWSCACTAAINAAWALRQYALKHEQ